jgi:hypothetical protein
VQEFSRAKIRLGEPVPVPVFLRSQSRFAILFLHFRNKIANEYSAKANHAKIAVAIITLHAIDEVKAEALYNLTTTTTITAWADIREGRLPDSWPAIDFFLPGATRR